MTEPQRAVAYLRQSERKAGESEQTSLSLTSQEQAFHRWCAANNAVTEELDAIKAERAALPEPPNEDEIRATFAMMSTFADALDALEPGDWRELLAAVGRAVFDETGVRIEYLPEIAPHVTAHTIPAPRWSRVPSQA